MAVLDQLVAGNWPAEDDAAYEAALASFGDSGSGIITIPGFPPILLEAGDALQTLYNIVNIILGILYSETYNPIVDVIIVIIEIVLQLLPLFVGRPRQEATLNCAHNLLKAKNSAATLAGIQILRMFQEWDIVISESGPGEVLVANVVAQMVNNLTGQGISLKRARGIVLYQFQQGADNLGAIAPALQVPVADGTPVLGPQGFQRVYQLLVDKLVAQGKTEAKAEEEALRLMLLYGPLRWLKHLYLGHQPGDPPPGVCLVGEHWDYTLNGGQGGCVRNKLPPPVPPPPWTPPPGTPPLGQPDPFGDEITNTLCQQMADNALATIYTLNQLQSTLPAATDPACCANIVAAISSIATAVNSVVAAIPAAPGAPVINFDPQIVVNVPPAPPPVITVNAPSTDVSGIVDQLRALFQTIDVKPPVYVQLEKDGYIPKGYAALMGQGDVGPGVVTGSATGTRTWWSWMIDAALGVSPDEPNRLIPDVPPDKNMLTKAFKSFLKAEDTVIEPFLTPLIDTVIGQLTPRTLPPIGSAGVDPEVPAQSAFAISINAALVAWLASYFGLDGGEPLSKMAEVVSGLVGFEELKDVIVGPLVRHGIQKVAEMKAKATFQQDIPGASAIASLVARGLMTPAAAKPLYAYDGLHTSLAPLVEQSAYHGMNARQMLRLIETNLFTNAEIADELTFSGMRPVSQHRMLLAAPYLATATQRNQARTALENAYKEGLFADGDLTAQIDSLEQNTDRDSLILFALHLDILVTETKGLVTEYASLFKVGSVDDVTFRAQLAGLGLQQWKIDLEAGKAEAAANVATFKKNIAEAAALARATAAEERKAAMQGFKTGVLNSAALAAALVLTGLTPIQSAAWVSLAGLQQSGNLRWIYGLLKSPAEAALLRERVAALADQRKRLQIDDSTFVGALQAMKIPDRYINALRAATDALITPKTAAVTIPVQTS